MADPLKYLLGDARMEPGADSQVANHRNVLLRRCQNVDCEMPFRPDCLLLPQLITHGLNPFYLSVCVCVFVITVCHALFNWFTYTTGKRGSVATSINLSKRL